MKLYVTLPRQVKILSDDHVDDLLVYAASTHQPHRNRLIVLLSVKAGLRASEIAKSNVNCDSTEGSHL